VCPRSDASFVGVTTFRICTGCPDVKQFAPEQEADWIRGLGVSRSVLKVKFPAYDISDV
jgi:hypothetical protein